MQSKIKYYTLYRENYLPLLKSKYQNYIRYNELEKINKIYIDVFCNKFLTDKQKEQIISELDRVPREPLH